jgi:hypothetical protein
MGRWIFDFRFLIFDFRFRSQIADLKSKISILALLCVQLLFLHFAQGRALAVSVHGNLTSAVWTRENRLEGPEESQTNVLVYEYLRLHATNLGSNKLAAHLSGRVGWDRFASFGEEYTGRLYQGYLDWKLSNKSSLRLGRQFLPNNVGFWQMDGVRFATRRSSFISPALYAGMAVLPWTIKGDNEAILGVELSTRRFLSIRSKLSFLTIFDNEGENWDVLGIRGMDKAILGIHFDTFDEAVLDFLESPHKRLNISGRGTVDVLAKEIIGGYVFANVRITPKGQLSLGYQQETFLFPADSIFAVFHSEPFRQLTIGMDYKVIDILRFQSRYARQFFDLDPIDRYSIGFTIRNQRETLLSLRLERVDDIDTHYWRTYSRIGKQLWRRFEISLNNYYNNYKLTRTPQTEEAYSFQLKLRYQLSRNLQALIRLEDNGCLAIFGWASGSRDEKVKLLHHLHLYSLGRLCSMENAIFHSKPGGHYTLS